MRIFNKKPTYMDKEALSIKFAGGPLRSWPELCEYAYKKHR